jgi:hypothetical protein
MSALHCLPSAELAPAFTAQLGALRRRVTASAGGKALYGWELGGDVLADLAGVLLRSFSRRVAPSVPEAWRALGDLGCRRAFARALGQYHGAFRGVHAGLPTTDFELHRRCAEGRGAGLEGGGGWG